MRNPLKRLASSPQPGRPLRERLNAAKGKLAAVKEKYGRTLRVHRALNAPLPKPEPVERIALINYATWLFYERRLVCLELYPDQGPKAGSFIHGNVAADGFHFPSYPATWESLPKPSTRAVATLDALGIDWRRDREDSQWGDDKPAEKPPAALPFGWPQVDADLTEALDDLTRIDAALGAMLAGASDRECDAIPGFGELEMVRKEILARFVDASAKSAVGFQAKAHALLTDGVASDCKVTGDITESLARDLIGARSNAFDQRRPDPMIAAIQECRRLEDACAAEYAKGNDGNATSEQSDAGSRVMDQWHGVVLKTVPLTAAGCAELARFAAGFCHRWGIALDAFDAEPGDGKTILDLIAHSPMRP